MRSGEQSMSEPTPARPERLMTPGEVANLFRVHVSTVARWATEGRLRAIVTPGGHRRYRREDVEELFGRSGAGE
jgi:excisionase family DNA binding protein